MNPIPDSSANQTRQNEGLFVAWLMLLAAADMRRQGLLPAIATGFGWQEAQFATVAVESPDAALRWFPNRGFEAGPALSGEQTGFVDLYLPMVAGSGGRAVVVGHLGQSLDARIATESGDSFFVTGRHNLVHLHRLRALADAIVVGAGTVQADDPRLTTRLVDGPNPVRVVIDPNRRLSDDYTVFSDGQADTLRVHALPAGDVADHAPGVLHVVANESGLDLSDLVNKLAERGLTSIFVEGGGVTLTRWMKEGQLDRLQLAVAPVLIGQGRPALQLPPALSMKLSLRPPHRIYRMGNDVLWDFDLRGDAQATVDFDDAEPFQRLR